MRRAALVGAGLLAAVWLLVLIGSLIGDDPGAVEGSGEEGAVLAVLVAVGLAALAWSVVDERRGGSVVIVVGLVLAGFGVVTAGRNQWFAALVAGGPFLAVGGLFVLHSRSAGGERHDVDG